MKIETLSTFPHMYDSVMGESIMKRAQACGALDFMPTICVIGRTTAIAPPTMIHTAADRGS